jgi:hypothetical protein
MSPVSIEQNKTSNNLSNSDVIKEESSSSDSSLLSDISKQTSISNITSDEYIDILVKNL